MLLASRSEEQARTLLKCTLRGITAIVYWERGRPPAMSASAKGFVNRLQRLRACGALRAGRPRSSKKLPLIIKARSSQSAVSLPWTLISFDAFASLTTSTGTRHTSVLIQACARVVFAAVEECELHS